MESEEAIKTNPRKTELVAETKDGAVRPPLKAPQPRTLGFALLTASTVFYVVAVAQLVFAPLPPEWRLGTAAVLAAAAEGAFSLSAVFLGHEVVQRHQRVLNPLNWFYEKGQRGMGHFQLKKRARQLSGGSDHDV